MKLGCTIIYVADVPATVTFYEAVFGLVRRFVHDSALYAELETGSTALAFAGIEAAEMGGFAVRPNTPTDVPAAYARAVGAGCTPVVAPTDKPWGQTVSYVRDLNGCLVELASPVSQAG